MGTDDGPGHEGAVVLAFPGTADPEAERAAPPRRLAGLVLGGLESLGRTMAGSSWAAASGRGSRAVRVGPCCAACGGPLPGSWWARRRPGPDGVPPAS